MSDAGLLLVCGTCSHECRVPERLVGRRIPCPHCRLLIEVMAAPVEVADRLVGKSIGGCILTRRLGAGALGVVYEAEEEGRAVAIKMLSTKAAEDPDVVTRFEREARLAAQIDHPHVVKVSRCGHDRGVNFLVMEYVDGPTLAQLVEEGGPIPWQRAAVLIRQVATALDHLAGLSIIHRDIKPANILIDTQGAPKLADLGLAKQISPGRRDTGLTMQGVAMGSPAYMAPEQVRSARDAGHAADMYSLGATFYHLLAGVPPFDGRNGSEILMKVLRQDPLPLTSLVPSLPAGIAGLVHQMLAKEIEDRPQTPAEAIAEIDAALAEPQQIRPRRRRVGTGTLRRRKRSSGGGAILALVAILILIAVIGWMLLR